MKIFNIIFQVIIFGTLTGSIVSICSIGFVLGVKNISNFRLMNSSCLIEFSGYCFSATPLVFLNNNMITITTIIIIIIIIIMITIIITKNNPI